MNKKDLQNAIREFLSKDGNSPITEANLTKAQLDKREDYLKQLKKNKKELVKRYGKDAESVMYGRATNLAKKAVSEMDKQKLKELVRNSLMNENKEFTEEEIQDTMDAFHMSREDAITHLQQTYEDYKQFDMKEGKKEDMDGDGDIDSKDYLLKRDAAIKKAKGEMKEANMFSTGGNINPELVKKVEQFVKGVAKYYDYSVDDAFSSIMTILKGGIAKEGVNEDIDLGHQDDEPHMIKGDLYQIGKYAMELYAMLEKYDEMNQEVDFPAWWQSKITVAKENMDGAKHYLEFELKEPAIDAAVDIATGEAPHMGEPMMEGDRVNEGIGTIALGIAGGLLLLKALGFAAKKIVGAISLNVTLPKEKLHKTTDELFKQTLITGGKLDMMSFMALRSVIKEMIDNGQITKLSQIIKVIEKASKVEPKKEVDEIKKDEIGKDEMLAGKIAKALKDMANKDASDQHNLKQARIALNKGNIDTAKKIADPYLEEGLPKGYFKKELGIGGKKKTVKEDWDTCIAKITDQGKSQKAAEKICGAINAAYVGNYRK